MSSWDPINFEGNKENSSQLWKKIKRLEKNVKEKDEIIIDLRRKVDAQSNYEDLLDELQELKKECANLKRSNTMLKNNQTT